jgi:Flp pilus assembly protein TadG
MKNSRNPVRRPRQRGHLALEMALCFLPLMALIFAIMDFSMVLFIQGAFNNATREAVRIGSTYNMTYPPAGDPNSVTYSDQTDLMKAVVQANAFGFLSGTLTDGTTALSHIAVNYYTADNLSTPVTAADLPKVVNSINVTVVNQSKNVVEVKISGYPWNWMVALPHYMPGTGMTLAASSLDIMQPLPTGVFSYPTP